MFYRITKAQQKRFRKDLYDSINKTNPFYIAAINAAILTILFSNLILYNLSLNDKYYDLELKVFEQAEQINKLKFLDTTYFPKEDAYSVPKESINCCADLILLLSGFPNFRFSLPFSIISETQLVSGNDVPKGSLERAELTLGLIQIITRSYPFPKGIAIWADGHDSMPIEPIVFQNFSQVKVWIEELQYIIHILSPIPTLERYSSEYLIEYFKALDKIDKNRIENNEILQLNLLAETDPYVILKNFSENLLKSEEIVASVKGAVKKFEYFQKHSVPSDKTLIIIYIAIFLVFIFGVILPILNNKVYNFFNIWIPSLFYLSVYIYFFYISFLGSPPD